MTHFTIKFLRIYWQNIAIFFIYPAIFFPTYDKWESIKKRTIFYLPMVEEIFAIDIWLFMELVLHFPSIVKYVVCSEMLCL